MARYQCTVCKYVYDEEAQGKPFSTLEKCPICKQPPSVFVLLEEPKAENAE